MLCFLLRNTVLEINKLNKIVVFYVHWNIQNYNLRLQVVFLFQSFIGPIARN